MEEGEVEEGGGEGEGGEEGGGETHWGGGMDGLSGRGRAAACEAEGACWWRWTWEPDV